MSCAVTPLHNDICCQGPACLALARFAGVVIGSGTGHRASPECRDRCCQQPCSCPQRGQTHLQPVAHQRRVTQTLLQLLLLLLTSSASLQAAGPAHTCTAAVCIMNELSTMTVSMLARALLSLLRGLLFLLWRRITISLRLPRCAFTYLIIRRCCWCWSRNSCSCSCSRLAGLRALCRSVLKPPLLLLQLVLLLLLRCILYRYWRWACSRVKKMVRMRG